MQKKKSSGRQLAFHLGSPVTSHNNSLRVLSKPANVVKDKETMKTEQVEEEEEKKEDKRAFWVLVSKFKRHCFNLIFQHGCHLLQIEVGITQKELS